MSLAAERHDIDGRTVLWQPRTGRGLVAGPELLAALDAPPPALRRRLEDLGLAGERDPATWVPARSAWAILVDGRLWHALPLERGSGGYAFAERALDGPTRALWRAINGSRTVADLADRCGLSVPSALEALGPLTALDVQAVQLRPGPTRATDPGLLRLVGPERPVHARAAHHYDDTGTTTLDRYHAEQITDGATHFDARETTLAHALARPHAALAGRPWGSALAAALVARGLPDGPILEIGPGTGELCAAFRTVLPEPAYVRLDLSPELLATQEARCPGTRSLRGSATAIPLPDESIAVVLCNEVIADLAAGPGPGAWPVAPEPGQSRFNTGAWEMLAEVARVLGPGGLAYVSEFGALDERPTETTHLDHPEVSIHFGQLLAVARSLGLEAEVLPVADLLGVDRTARWLCRPSWEAVRSRCAAAGLHLASRAWLPEELDLPWTVEGLLTVPITDPGPAPILDRVLALVARKPAT